MLLAKQSALTANRSRSLACCRQVFHGPQADGGSDLFMTMKTLRARAGDMTRPLRARNVIARLRLGVTIEQARAQMTAQWRSARGVDIPGLPAVDRDTMQSQTVAVDPIGARFSPLRDRFADPLILLVGLTALLLAVGCANLSGLLLARAAARDQQVAVRRALGASRARLVQHLIVETLLLAMLGTSAAIPFAWWTSRLIGMVLTAGNALPVTMKWTPDGRVLTASALVALATGLIVGLLPAWRATRIDVAL
jgi:FtsX-like permease family